MTGTTPSRADPFQLFLPMFPPHEEAVMRQAYAKRMIKREKARIKYVHLAAKNSITTALDNISASFLDMPLGPIEDEELSTCFDPLLAPDDDFGSLTDEVATTWSDDAIATLHEELVIYSLRLLNARGNAKEKKSILEWIFNPQRMAVARDVEGLGPRWEIINASAVPFGFDLCCRLSGYDPERIREGLVPILKQTELDELFNEVEYERTNEQQLRAAKLSGSIDIQHSRGAGKSAPDGFQTGPAGRAEDRPVLHL